MAMIYGKINVTGACAGMALSVINGLTMGMSASGTRAGLTRSWLNMDSEVSTALMTALAW